MTIERIDNVLNFSVDPVMTLAMAALLLLLGYFMKKKIPVLEKYCIPAPVIGGFLFMFISWIGHATGGFAFQFDTMFQAPMMLAFFTTVGLGASISLLKKGGKLLVIYWLICGVVSIIQNGLGMLVSTVTGLEPAYALLSSSISMLGGHGAAAAYGTTFQEMGYASAPVVGAAAATFGLIFGVLIGGPLARRLIEKNKLTPDTTENLDTSIEDINTTAGVVRNPLDIMKNVTGILVCMGLGTIVSGWIGKAIGMSFPTYVGAMFIAMILRNVNEKVSMYKFDFSLVGGIGDVMLGLYLSMAMMTLEPWQLVGLAGPMLLVVVCQVIVLALLAYFVVFRLLGKNYDAAVMVSGLMGHGLGATPSAIVNMTAINERYGMSRRAMIIVPIVGAFLVDIIYQPVTIWFIKTFVQNLTG